MKKLILCTLYTGRIRKTSSSFFLRVLLCYIRFIYLTQYGGGGDEYLLLATTMSTKL